MTATVWFLFNSLSKIFVLNDKHRIEVELKHTARLALW